MKRVGIYRQEMNEWISLAYKQENTPHLRYLICYMTYYKQADLMIIDITDIKDSRRYNRYIPWGFISSLSTWEEYETQGHAKIIYPTKTKWIRKRDIEEHIIFDHPESLFVEALL